MLKYLLSWVLVLFVYISFAGTIKGTVTEEKNGAPLVGLVVLIKGTDKGVATDIDGKYEITGIKPGVYEITFKYFSFVTQIRSQEIKGAETVTLDVKMKEEVTQLKSAEVKSKKITHTEAAVINEIKTSNAVVSGTSASQISKTMDRTAADVVKRIPGVAIQDDRFIVVRGLADRYNTVWLNDAGAPSSESDKKSFSFDIIPSGLIDRILIFKTPSAELPGDFAGGMVKVYTTTLQDKNSLSVNLQTSSRQYTTGQAFTYTKSSSTDVLGYDDGGRSLPSDVPARLDKVKNPEVSKSFKNDWQLLDKTAMPDVRFAMGLTGVKKYKKITIGNTLGVSYSNTQTINNVDRKDWDSSTSMFYHYNDKISTANVSVGILENAGISFGNSKIEFKNLYSQAGKSSVIQREAYVDSVTTPERIYVMGYESKATYAAQLTGSHKSKNEDIKYNWTAGYTDVFKNQPNLRRIKYIAQNPDSPFYATVASNVDPVFGGGRTYSQLYEHVYSFNHQFSKKIHFNEHYSFTINMGNYLEAKRRNFDLRWFSYTLTTIKNPNATWLKLLPLDQIFIDSNVGFKNKFIMDEGTNSGDKYTGKNDLIASFISFNLPIGDKINVVAGVRDEENTFSILGYNSTDTLNEKVKTSYLLPSVNATYNINPKTLVRVAYGKTLNRPEFRESSPIFYYDFEEIASVKGSLANSTSNPYGNVLKTAEVQNIDVRYEYYPSSGEMIHVGFFFKTIKNSIQRVVDYGTAGETKTLTYINADNAYTMGLEIDIRKNLAFLDKILSTKFFNQMTFVGNFAFSKSELKIDTSKVLGQMPKSVLQGQSPYIVNLGLYYQSDDKGIKGSVLYNVYGPRLYASGSNVHGAESIGELPFHSLDITLSKIFFKHYSVSLGIQNLLDSEIRFVKDINRDNKFSTTDGDLDYKVYSPGRYYTIGVKINLP
jgi:outer membrane receptor protein involved in Fe transport